MLDLFNNGTIGERGGKEIAEMLRENRKLTSLDLSGTNIGQGGGSALGLVLRENNRTLTRLDVSGNKVGAGDLACCAALVRRAASIRGTRPHRSGIVLSRSPRALASRRSRS